MNGAGRSALCMCAPLDPEVPHDLQEEQSEMTCKAGMQGQAWLGLC